MKKTIFLSTVLFCLLTLVSCDFIVKNVYLDGNTSGGGGGGGNDGDNGGGGGDSGQINWNAAQISISTEAHLREIARLVNAGTNQFNGRTITLMNNIEIQSGAWVPIGNANNRTFNGTFNGNGNIVSGIKINSTSDLQGFFGNIASVAIVRNLGVIVDITGGGIVGGLAGRNQGTIENCFAEGNIIGSGDRIGGLVGINTSGIPNGNIINSYFIGVVAGNDFVGGLVGDNQGAIERTYAAADVSAAGNNTRVGGLAGLNFTPTWLTRSFASGNVVGNRLVGSGNANNSRMITEAEMRQQETFINWDFSTIWRIIPETNNGFPHLRVFE
ncbi:MAG: hypothetical protein FWE23_01335 [Chitinivibrionia bacterium]|nr:hypothetical protein [Chitinivibrionia bacterium]